MMDYKQTCEFVKNMSNQEKDKLIVITSKACDYNEYLKDSREILDELEANSTERSRVVYNIHKEYPSIGLPIILYALGVSSSAYYHAKKIFEHVWEDRFYNVFAVVVLADAITIAKKPRDFEKEYPGVPIDQFLF